MPPAKKAAKKSTGHSHDGHGETKDLRRAYEHMGRLGILRALLKSPVVEGVAELTRLAQIAIKSERAKDAADLLRASEHLSFAVLAGEGSRVGPVSSALQSSIKTHFDELARKADEHWTEGDSNALAELYHRTRKHASKAFKEGNYHQAMEFIRAAETLAHVKGGSLELAPGLRNPKLISP